MISASLLQEAFPKAFRPIILVTTSLLKGSVGKNQSLYFSVLSVPPWCFFFLAISTRRHGEHGEIRFSRQTHGRGPQLSIWKILPQMHNAMSLMCALHFIMFACARAVCARQSLSASRAEKPRTLSASARADGDEVERPVRVRSRVGSEIAY